MGGVVTQLTNMMAGFIEQQAHRAAAERFGKLDDVADRFDSVVDLSDQACLTPFFSIRHPPTGT
jgi:hypothetical protein